MKRFSFTKTWGLLSVASHGFSLSQFCSLFFFCSLRNQCVCVCVFFFFFSSFPVVAVRGTNPTKMQRTMDIVSELMELSGYTLFRFSTLLYIIPLAFLFFCDDERKVTAQLLSLALVSRSHLVPVVTFFFFFLSETDRFKPILFVCVCFTMRVPGLIRRWHRAPKNIKIERASSSTSPDERDAQEDKS